MKKLKILSLILVTVFAVMGFIPQNTYAETRKNSQYSLAGAEYTLYKDAACTQITKDKSGNDAILTTDAEGKTNTIDCKGKYPANIHKPKADNVKFVSK